ncbi:outer membrane biogenesis protein BamE [mine drainage metagenome]|uniref:Outer membrane biogenesis protein BamE n=1 Tax=mine drainage metagenome TaxID=410659 RepID=A0A1J5PMA2_9ZZZZ
MSKGLVLMRAIAALVFMASLVACTAIYENHGYAPTDLELSQIKVGDTPDAVTKALGAPSIKGVIGQSDWYYVQSRWRHYGAFAPKEIKREVVAISFTPKGRVENIERFGLEKGHVVVISRRVTTSTVKSIGLVQQLFQDLGHMNPGTMFKSTGAGQ